MEKESRWLRKSGGGRRSKEDWRWEDIPYVRYRFSCGFLSMVVCTHLIPKGGVAAVLLGRPNQIIVMSMGTPMYQSMYSTTP